MIVQLNIEQQDRITGYPDVGDVMELTRLRGLKGYSSLTIKSVEREHDKNKIKLVFENSIPNEIMKSDVLANVSKAAKVKFTNNNIHNNRARGILIQSRDVLIENNKFSNCTGTAIYITCSKYWWEALSSKNVQILNNKVFEYPLQLNLRP